MKDFLGVEILVGDEVISYHPLYKDLTLYTAEGFTPQMVRLRYGNRKYESVLRNPSVCIVNVAKRKAE
jgi:hypothetical protein